MHNRFLASPSEGRVMHNEEAIHHAEPSYRSQP